MLHSMTGFAAGQGGFDGWTWTWDMRAVNGRGLDIRLRMPDWIDGLESAARAQVQKSVSRGNVTLSLRLTRHGEIVAARIDAAVLDRVLAQIAEIESAAMTHGVNIVAPSATDILNQRGIVDTSGNNGDTGNTAALAAALIRDLTGVIAGFNAMRGAEGRALQGILTAQLDQIEILNQEVKVLCAARADQMRAALRDALARVMDNTEGADPDRVAQELAIVAVKTDITEELDRLSAHVTAARDLLDHAGPVGRKLDFLMQEFNREANTLCSKAQNIELTRVGLALKSSIDQMREQVQNVE